MLTQYEPLRNKIREYAIKEKDYAKVIKLCFEYLRELNSLNIDEELKKDDKNYIYYEIALNAKKKDDFKTAIKYTLISFNYMRDYTGVKYINRLWILAVCYTKVGNIDEAKKIYYKCSKLFKDVGEQKQRALIIFNNAKLMMNCKTMKKIIKLFESNLLKETIQTYGDYDDVLRDLYTELLELYILDDRREEAFKLLYSMQNKSLRKELAIKLVA